MTEKDYVAKTTKYIKDKFSGEGSGHDWWHMYRVWQLSKEISKNEQEADHLVVELAALLHDIADWKFNNGDVEAGPKAAREWLMSINVPEYIIEHVEEIIRTVSYKGAGVASNMKTIEGKIIHDADKIDAMGAIGIARVFAYGGSASLEIFNPEIKPILHKTFEEYKNSKKSSINHFYEKLLLLKDRMYTDIGKHMAEKRHKYMEKYLEEFYKEWDGKA